MTCSAGHACQPFAILRGRKFSSDIEKYGIKLGADRRDVPDDDDRDQGCDQAVFDGRDAFFFAQKVFDEVHDGFPFKIKNEHYPSVAA